jgi:hypothetical protein
MGCASDGSSALLGLRTSPANLGASLIRHVSVNRQYHDNVR